MRSTFSYHFDDELAVGQRVAANFAGRNVIGYIARIGSKPQFKTKPISKPLENQVYLSPEDVALINWTVENYLASIGKVFDLFFPPGKLLKSNSHVIPLSPELPFSTPLKMSEALKLLGKEQFQKLKSQRKLKILHSYEKKLPSKRRIKLLKLPLSIKTLESLKLTKSQKKVIDYLLSVEKATPQELMNALSLKSRSPIDTLLRKEILVLEEVEEDETDRWTIEAIEKLTAEQEHVREAQKILERDSVSEAIKTLPMQSKAVLFAVYALTKKGKRDIFTGECFNVYTEVARALSLDTLTQRRVSDLISELDMLGLINTTVISKGRYGRTKKIRLAVSRKQIGEVLDSEPRLSRIAKDLFE